MQPNELTALLTKTDEVAFEFSHVEVEISNQRNRRGQIFCPTGLIKGKVIMNGYHWTEHRTIAVCGDQSYEINRKNGVLVEVDRDDFPNWDETNIHISGRKVYFRNGAKTVKQMTPYPHATAIHRDGKTFIRIITSRKAIFSSWGEYALEIAKREKAQKDEQAKRNALRHPQAAIMGVTPEEFGNLYTHSSNERNVYLNANWEIIEYVKDANGNDIYENDNYGHIRRVPKKEVGKIEITVDQANKILAMLTPAQKKKLKNG